MEDVSGGDRPPAAEAAVVPEPGTSQESAREPGASQEGTTETGATEKGTGKPNTHLEGTREPNISQEGASKLNSKLEGASKPSQEGNSEPGTRREGPNEANNGLEGTISLNTPQEGTSNPNTTQEGTIDPNTSQESTRALNTSQKGTRDPSSSQEGTRDPNTSQEGTRDPNTSQDSTRDPSTSQEGTRDPSTSQEGTRALNTSQKGTRDPNTSQEGTRDPNTSQDSTRALNTSRKGTRDSNTSQEGTRDPNTSQEGTRDPNISQEGTRDPNISQEDTRDPEASVGLESVGDLSAGHIKGDEAMEEDDQIGSSQHQGKEPEGTSDDPSKFRDESEDYTAEMDQEPKEEAHHLLQNQEDTEQDHELQEMIHEEQILEELIQQYHALVQERDKIIQHNAQLQHKLYEYFRKKKGEEIRPETSKRASDLEQRYLKYLTSLEEMRRRNKEEAALHQEQVEELRAQSQDIVSKVDKEWAAFQEQKKKTVLCILSKQGAGKHAASSLIQEVDLLQSREERKEKEVIQVRLENIKLKNHIKRYESTLRSKEEQAEGLHLIDFEQLKIENQTYNEKIEESNEALLKLRKKITNTVQVLTHIKEKLQFVQAENQEQKEKLMEVEALVGSKRDILTKTKQARDGLRMDNLKLKQKCGLLGNEVLLRDFEDKVDATEDLRQTLENLKRRHAELTLSSKGLEKKINEVKMVMDD